VPKMRREGRPDPGISLGDQSAVVNRVQAPSQIRAPGKDADQIIQGPGRISCRERNLALINLKS
jgi:hypothetical protein